MLGYLAEKAGVTLAKMVPGMILRSINTPKRAAENLVLASEIGALDLRLSGDSEATFRVRITNGSFASAVIAIPGAVLTVKGQPFQLHGGRLRAEVPSHRGVAPKDAGKWTDVVFAVTVDQRERLRALLGASGFPFNGETTSGVALQSIVEVRGVPLPAERSVSPVLKVTVHA